MNGIQYKIKHIAKCPTYGNAQYLLSIILSVVITIIELFLHGS